MLNMNKKIILIVDDMPENIAILHQILRADYKTKAATSGEKALLISQKTPTPDIILLDIIMPIMNGYEVFEQLKSNPETADIPIIFVTGKSRPVDCEKGLALGAADYISKPVNPALLLQKIKQQLCEDLPV